MKTRDSHYFCPLLYMSRLENHLCTVTTHGLHCALSTSTCPLSSTSSGRVVLVLALLPNLVLSNASGHRSLRIPNPGVVPDPP